MPDNNRPGDLCAVMLLPCPFCGGEGLPHRVAGFGRLWTVSCKRCDANPNSSIGEQAARQKWNARHRLNATTDQSAEIARLRAALEQAAGEFDLILMRLRDGQSERAEGAAICGAKDARTALNTKDADR